MNSHKPLLMAAYLLAAGLCIGCSRSNLPETFPVSGTVLRGGEPLPGVNVTFTPEEGRPATGRTDEQGRFTITDVPPGTYQLVVWHPYIRTRIEQTVTIEPKGTAEANVAVPAPTGRLYANEVLDHAYIRYNATEETKKEIEPMIKKQHH